MKLHQRSQLLTVYDRSHVHTHLGNQDNPWPCPQGAPGLFRPSFMQASRQVVHDIQGVLGMQDRHQEHQC